MYYAVNAGGHKEIFVSWEDAKGLISKYPSTAKYKKFNNRQDAVDFLTDTQICFDFNFPAPEQSEAALLKTMEGTTAIAYTDGSYENKLCMWGAGAFIYDSKNPNVTFTEMGCGTEFNEHRNVTGELVGALLAINKAIDEGFNNIIIYHDYEGVGKWADGKWRAKIELTQRYVYTIHTLRKKINIKFQWIRGHCGVKLNEVADKLANESIAKKELVLLDDIFHNEWM